MTREEAIKILTEIQTKHKKYIGQTECNNALNMAIEALQQEEHLVELEAKAVAIIKSQRHGEWKCMADCGVTECDQCGWSIEEYVGDYNYCPNCGADMRGEK